jgi:hypothetical protein
MAELVTRMIPETLLHYRILQPLGEGGPPPFAQGARELRRGLAEAQPVPSS